VISGDPRRRVVKGVGLALILFGCGSRAAAHEPVLLDSRRATPGLRLELVEVPPVTPASAVPGYRLVAAGLPSGVMFSVWTKDFGHPFHEVAPGFRLDAAGKLVAVQRDGAGEPRYLDQMVFEPGAYPRGAIWEVALVSVDRTITAFAKVIPRPITASDGPCVVSLELVSHRGERFLATGAGFPPGDDVIIESRHSSRVSQKQGRISATGLLPTDVISHAAIAAIGPDRSARYSVKGRYCEVTLEYQWGEPALRER
jgi:hypothetical protein